MLLWLWLAFLFCSFKVKTVKKEGTGTRHLKVRLKLGFKLNHLLRNRAQNLVKDDFCWSFSAREVPGGILAIVLDIPCATKILRIGDFKCFAGTIFFDQDRLIFQAGN